MTLDIARHLRMVTSTFNDEFVTKRKGAITELADRFRRRNTAKAVMNLAQSLVGALASSSLEISADVWDEAATAISAQAPSFVADKSARLEVLVCCLLASAQAIQHEKTRSSDGLKTSWLARSFRSGLSFQPARAEPKLEELRLELEKIADEVAELEGYAARRRHEIKMQGDSPALDEGETADDADSESHAQFAIKLAGLLAKNAEVDREEIDLLWWALNGRSELLGGEMKTGEPLATAVASGVEMGFILKRAPIEAHRHLAARNLPVTISSGYVLDDVVAINRDFAAKVMAKLEGAADLAKRYPNLFPLLSAVSLAANLEPASRLGPLATNQAQKPLVYWVRRALDETMLARNAMTDLAVMGER